MDMLIGPHANRMVPIKTQDCQVFSEKRNTYKLHLKYSSVRVVIVIVAKIKFHCFLLSPYEELDRNFFWLSSNSKIRLRSNFFLNHEKILCCLPAHFIEMMAVMENLLNPNESFQDY